MRRCHLTLIFSSSSSFKKMMKNMEIFFLHNSQPLGDGFGIKDGGNEGNFAGNVAPSTFNDHVQFNQKSNSFSCLGYFGPRLLLIKAYS